MESLRRYITSAPAARLAGAQQHLLRSTKINEFLHAARFRRITEQDVATFAQSAHPRLLNIFERGARLPRGYFLSITRMVQYPNGNPFKSDVAPPPRKQQRYMKEMERKLMSVVRLHRERGGKAMPHALQLLTSTSHLVAPRSPAEDKKVVKAAVQDIPLLELSRRHAYIMKLDPRQVLSRMPSRAVLGRRKGELVNFDHLLGPLAKIKDGKLLIEIYAENVPKQGRFDRYLPVTALGEGSYCVDDIARTTVALLQEHRRRPDPRLLSKARAGLSFVKMMQSPDGEFYNFASIKKGKLAVNKRGATSKKGIDFWAARALWAMGEGYAALAQKDARGARELVRALERTLPHLERPLSAYGRFTMVKNQRLPRWLVNDAADQTSVLLKGLLAYHRGLPRGKLRQRVSAIIAKYADGLAAAQITTPRSKDYGRFIHSMKDPGATHLWGSRQVEVLAEASTALSKTRGKEWLRAAMRCADNYWGKTTPARITTKGEEQIAYGIETVVSGYARLFQATGKRGYINQTYRWSSWFFGKNEARAVVYDPLSGRGYDGLRPIAEGRLRRYSINSNAGAESTVEALLAMQSARLVPGVHRRLTLQLEKMLPR